VIAGPSLVIVDAGAGSARNLNRIGLRAGAIEAVFLTHFHSDHIDGRRARDESLGGRAAEAGNANLAQIAQDIPGYHTTPVEAAEIAREAGVKALLLDHIVSPLRVPGIEAAFLDGVAEQFHGGVVLGRDGTVVSLPARSTEVVVSNRF
jgi:ribonuclease BN (tRNA processing enzyme)